MILSKFALASSSSSPPFQGLEVSIKLPRRGVARFSTRIRACAEFPIQDPGPKVCSMFGIQGSERIEGFMRMCTAATTPPFDAHAHRCNESGCCCFNGL